MPRKRTSRQFADALPDLLKERRLSIRALARLAGVGDDHISRVLRGARGKRPTGDLARRVAIALNLPPDYFLESRLEYVTAQLAEDPALLDEVYDKLRRRASRRPSRSL